MGRNGAKSRDEDGLEMEIGNSTLIEELDFSKEIGHVEV